MINLQEFNNKLGYNTFENKKKLKMKYGISASFSAFFKSHFYKEKCVAFLPKIMK